MDDTAFNADLRKSGHADSAADTSRTSDTSDAGDAREAVPSTEQLVAIGGQIRRYRVAMGISQERFALQVGLPRSYYGALERGERNFSVLKMMRIAEGLGVEVGRLFPSHMRLARGMMIDADVELPAPRGLTPGPKRHAHRQALSDEQIQLVGDDGEEGGEGEKKPGLVSAGAAAKMLGVNRRTIARWVAGGVLPALFVEDNRGEIAAVFRRKDILEYAEARRKKRSDKGTGKQKQ
jgi:transcriptional regulator with XRE-family HTH domain